MPFASLGLHESLLRAVRELGFTRPTKVQESAIPPALQGRDVLACAMTGSGKTAAFALPILHRLLHGKRRGLTRALVLSPTRELAAQIEQHINDLAVHTPIGSAVVFGGVGMGPQEHALRGGVDVIVATPGRLLDHMQQKYCRFDGLEVLVLDEADRMLDMGFLPDIQRILRHLPARRQTLFFSATMPKEILALSRQLLHQPVLIQHQREAAPAVGITQAVYPVPEHLKAELLIELLDSGEVEDVLVFTRTKHRADKVSKLLARAGFSSGRLHGNRSQAQRTKALEEFKSGATRVIVATDIASRGIDIEQLGHVINYDVPNVVENYIHRVGRTARAEATGDAFTFVAPHEEDDLYAIEKAIGRRLPRITLPEFDYDKPAPAKAHAGGARHPRGHQAQPAQPRARAPQPRWRQHRRRR